MEDDRYPWKKDVEIRFPDHFPPALIDKIDAFLSSEDAKALGINNFDDCINFVLKRLLYNTDELLEKWEKESTLERVKYPISRICNCRNVIPDVCYMDDTMYEFEPPSDTSLSYATCIVHRKCNRPIRPGLTKEWAKKNLSPPPMWYQVLDK